jgi:hypothetical protein
MSDNPPAFPVADVRTHDGFGLREGSDGMTLRDWFAAQADQPGVSEIVAMAGGQTDGFHVKFSPDGTEYKFNEWWNDLPLADRLELAARVRFAYADAMLTERSKP